MKTIKAIGVFGALALAALLPAASDSVGYMRVHIPFSFVVAGQQFAAGDYVVKQSDNGVVLVQGARKGAMVMSTPAFRSDAGSSSSLRFTNNGEQFNLVTVAEQGVQPRSIPVRAVEQRALTLSSH